MTATDAALPHRGERLFLTDGGLETTLVFLDGIELPLFAAFVLLDTAEGRRRLHDYYVPYVEIARARGLGFILESPTWRASPDWAARLGYAPVALDALNRQAIELMKELRTRYEAQDTPMLISGCVGPRGDGYVAGEAMSPAAAAAYHEVQIASLGQAGAELITAITMTNVPEAVGITQAARAAGLPAVISFTVETDGRLPSGESLAEAIAAVDAATQDGPAYYMLNCAHPTHFADVLTPPAPWQRRIGGIRANASCKSHAELDASTTLDAGDPAELAARYAELQRALPGLRVLGGCCGTDHRHIEAMARRCSA